MGTTAADLDPLEQSMNSSETIPTLRHSFFIAIDVAIVTTCILSILGAGSIMVSFLWFKELRTTSRFLLFHLSIADAVVAVTNLIGASHRTITVLADGDTSFSNGSTVSIPCFFFFFFFFFFL